MVDKYIVEIEKLEKSVSETNMIINKNYFNSWTKLWQYFGKLTKEIEILQINIK